MTDQRYFHNFAPADAVQYDGTNDAQIAAQFDIDGWWVRLNATTGQWLVRQGDRVWVQDEEPARVEHTSWSVFYPHRAADGSDGQAQRIVFVEERKETYARKILSEASPQADARLEIQHAVRTQGGFLWTGPWSPVEGGAE